MTLLRSQMYNNEHLNLRRPSYDCRPDNIFNIKDRNRIIARFEGLRDNLRRGTITFKDFQTAWGRLFAENQKHGLTDAYWDVGLRGEKDEEGGKYETYVRGKNINQKGLYDEKLPKKQ